jgi:hypothetical protein
MGWLALLRHGSELAKAATPQARGAGFIAELTSASARLLGLH